MQETIINTPTVTLDQRVAILVDGNNIEFSLHNNLSKYHMLDFDKFIPNVLKGRSLNRIKYFREGKSISPKLQERLNTKYFGSVIPCLKSADVPLTIQAMQLCEKVDTMIICSGDKDYVELVEFLKMKGLRVEIAACKEALAPELVAIVDDVYYITAVDTWKFQPSVHYKPNIVNREK